jgi:hypothetical protein
MSKIYGEEFFILLLIFIYFFKLCKILTEFINQYHHPLKTPNSILVSIFKNRVKYSNHIYIILLPNN